MSDITLTLMSPKITCGRELVAREAFDQAYDYFDTMLKREPNNAIAKSFVGYLTAVYKKRAHEGLEICQEAVNMNDEEPLLYLNLAKVYVLVDDRRLAVKTIQKGLKHKSSPYKNELLNYYRFLGVRKKPPLAFLGRSNPLNVILGKLKKK
jgi:predicted Zn-dependent protease